MKGKTEEEKGGNGKRNTRKAKKRKWSLGKRVKSFFLSTGMKERDERTI